ncbi:MAG: hypothetical protein Q9227_003245 [Pyrenula ochraceoflavens]
MALAGTPVTILTGFLGSGKTTLILNLIPQLPTTYKLALLKNEFGDLAVDSKLASQKAISGVRELLNGCICCNLVGQLSDALVQLREEVNPDRIIIETSGSAFPATLAMEVSRLSRERDGAFVLDGVISVIDVENWKGYEDTSYTAKMQARYTDLIVFNKWEMVDERRFDECLDRVGDLDLPIAWVKSVKGWVDQDVIMGIDGALVAKEGALAAVDVSPPPDHEHHHQSEVEVLSIALAAESEVPSPVDVDSLEDFLLSAPKDEVYRIKGLLVATQPPDDSTGQRSTSITEDSINKPAVYVLNWAFSRWNITLLNEGMGPLGKDSLRLTIVLARGEATKWKKRIENEGLLKLQGDEQKSSLTAEKVG